VPSQAADEEHNGSGIKEGADIAERLGIARSTILEQVSGFTLE
jgi:hypothetical protein